MGGELQKLRKAIEQRDKEFERFYKQNEQRFKFVNNVLQKQTKNDGVISEVVVKVHDDVIRLRDNRINEGKFLDLMDKMSDTQIEFSKNLAESTKAIQMSNAMCRRMFKTQSVMWTHILKQDNDRKVLLNNIDKLQNRITKMKDDQKGLALMVESLRFTLSEMTWERKKEIDEIIKNHLDINVENTVALNRLQELLQAENIGEELEKAGTLDNMKTFKDALDIIVKVQKNIKEENLQKELKDSFDKNVEKVRQRLGWYGDATGLEWSSEPMRIFNKTMEEDEKNFKITDVGADSGLKGLAEEYIKAMSSEIDGDDNEFIGSDEVSIFQ